MSAAPEGAAGPAPDAAPPGPGLPGVAGGWLGRLRARLAARRGEAPEVRDALCLVVSESGWRAVLHPGDGGPPVASGEAVAPEEAPASTPDVLRRAVRSITAAQRERLDSVRLVVDDAAFGLADNRALRLRSTDPVAVRHAGTQELGSKGAVYAFLPFGASSEGEVPRGAYTFASAERIGDYLSAMDSLAPRLVGLVPAWLSRLEAAGPGPFAAIELRAEGGTLVLADPDGGALACRPLPVGTRTLAGALAGATGVTLREAAEGLARRRCLPEAAPDPALPPTLAAHALAAPLAALRTALLDSLDFFVFQRLAAPPERLLLSGEAARVRGLAEWLSAVLEVEVLEAPGLMPAPGPRAGEGTNLLESTPQQLLRVGRSGYEFVDGRFRAEQRQGAEGQGGAGGRGGLRGLATQPLSLAALRALPSALASALRGPGAGARPGSGSSRGTRAPTEPSGSSGWRRRGPRLPVPLPGAPVLVVAALAGLALVAAVLPWGSGAPGGGGAVAALADQLAADASLRRELTRRDATPPPPPDVPLPWSGRLLALARLPAPVRLTVLAVLPDASQPGRDGRLSLEGRLPASAGAMAEVAATTDRLAADPGFRAGLAAPALEGVTIVKDAGVKDAGVRDAGVQEAGMQAAGARESGAVPMPGGGDATEFVLSAPVLPTPASPAVRHP